MAKNTKFRRTEKEIKKQGGFGTYREDTGGGEPIEKGGKWKPHKEERRVTNQPRTKDGQFTYNSVNGRPLKEISKGSDGKSRGTTIPPTLTGGKNGVHFKGQKYQANSQRFDQLKKHYEKFDGEFYRKGDEVVFQGHIKIAKEDMVESLQEYAKRHFRDYDVSKWDTKVGRHSKSETAAIAGTKGVGKQHGESFVIDLNKGDIVNYIKNKIRGKQAPNIPSNPINVNPAQTTPTPNVPNVTQNQPSVSASSQPSVNSSGITQNKLGYAVSGQPNNGVANQPATNSTSTYTAQQKADFDKIRNALSDEDLGDITDDEIQQLIDETDGGIQQLFSDLGISNENENTDQTTDSKDTDTNISNSVSEENKGTDATSKPNPRDSIKHLSQKQVWNNDDLQDSIKYLNDNPEEWEKIKAQISDYSGASDARAIEEVVDGGYYEDFDKYDSDVAEQFISMFKDIILGQGETEEQQKARASELFNTDLNK